MKTSIWGLHVNDEQLAQSVLAYLTEHPRAMDSVEGIAQWWIMQQQIRVNITTLTRVLRGLVDRGLLEVFGDEGHRWYRLKAS